MPVSSVLHFIYKPFQTCQTLKQFGNAALILKQTDSFLVVGLQKQLYEKGEVWQKFQRKTDQILDNSFERL